MRLPAEGGPSDEGPDPASVLNKLGSRTAPGLGAHRQIMRIFGTGQCRARGDTEKSGPPGKEKQPWRCRNQEAWRTQRRQVGLLLWRWKNQRRRITADGRPQFLAIVKAGHARITFGVQHLDTGQLPHLADPLRRNWPAPAVAVVVGSSDRGS